MSFSKAKILRFNDIKSCAPPPGAYTPKFKEPVVGAVIPLSERFIEPKSPATVSTCSDSHSVCSTNSMPTFRTPTKPLLYRKKIMPNADEKKKLAVKENLSPKKSEALREKIVECLNKDVTIKELESQIEELKEHINHLIVERNEIITEKQDLMYEIEKLKTQKEEDLSELKKEYDNQILELNTKFLNSQKENEEIHEQYKIAKTELIAKNLEEMGKLKENIDLLEKLLQQTVDERELLIKSIEDKLMESELRCQNLQSDLFVKIEELKILDEQLKESKKAQEELENNHASEIKSLNKLHESEVQDLEYELLKIATEWRKVVENLEQEHKKKLNDLNKTKQSEIELMSESYIKQINDIKLETDAKIKQANENCYERIKLAEIQMEEKRREIEADWAIKLKEQQEKSDEILKECQSISEFSIMQCELEKKQIVKRLQDEKDVIDAENIKLQEIISKLKTEMSGIIIELNETRTELGRQKEKHLQDITRTQIEKHSYEVTLNKTHETVETLKNRLLNSDRDVEQLKLEIENKENNLLFSENNIIMLKEKLNLIKIEKQTLENENYHLNFEMQRQIKTIENNLKDKIDQLKSIYENEIDNTKTLYETKNKELSEVVDQLHEQQSIIVSAQELLKEAEVKNEGLITENDELKHKLLKQENMVNNTVRSKSEEFLKQLKSRDDEIEALKRLVQSQNALIGPFREQLEMYEKENKMLLNDKREAELEAKEINLKYAEMLGHQNKKQKIKYMVDLKKKNLELLEAKIENEAKLHKQSVLIDKLNYELKTLQSKKDKKNRRRSRSLITENKENILSPAKTPQNISFKIDSPLKDRN